MGVVELAAVQKRVIASLEAAGEACRLVIGKGVSCEVVATVLVTVLVAWEELVELLVWPSELVGDEEAITKSAKLLFVS